MGLDELTNGVVHRSDTRGAAQSNEHAWLPLWWSLTFSCALHEDYGIRVIAAAGAASNGGGGALEARTGPDAALGPACSQRYKGHSAGSSQVWCHVWKATHVLDRSDG
jgi:hypothetical protein